MRHYSKGTILLF